MVATAYYQHAPNPLHGIPQPAVDPIMTVVIFCIGASAAVFVLYLLSTYVNDEELLARSQSFFISRSNTPALEEGDYMCEVEVEPASPQSSVSSCSSYPSSPYSPYSPFSPTPYSGGNCSAFAPASPHMYNPIERFELSRPTWQHIESRRAPMAEIKM